MKERDEGHPHESISAWIDGQLSEEDALRLQEHLRGCAHCRALVEDLRLLSATAARDEPPPVPADLASRIGWRVRALEKDRGGAQRPGRWLRAFPLTAVATLAAVGLLVVLRIQERPGPVQLEKSAPAVERQRVSAKDQPGAGRTNDRAMESPKKLVTTGGPSPLQASKSPIKPMAHRESPVAKTEVEEDRLDQGASAPVSAPPAGATLSSGEGSAAGFGQRLQPAPADAATSVAARPEEKKLEPAAKRSGPAEGVKGSRESAFVRAIQGESRLQGTVRWRVADPKEARRKMEALLAPLEGRLIVVDSDGLDWHVEVARARWPELVATLRKEEVLDVDALPPTPDTARLLRIEVRLEPAMTP